MPCLRIFDKYETYYQWKPNPIHVPLTITFFWKFPATCLNSLYITVLLDIILINGYNTQELNFKTCLLIVELTQNQVKSHSQVLITSLSFFFFFRDNYSIQLISRSSNPFPPRPLSTLYIGNYQFSYKALNNIIQFQVLSIHKLR